MKRNPSSVQNDLWATPPPHVPLTDIPAGDGDVIVVIEKSRFVKDFDTHRQAAARVLLPLLHPDGVVYFIIIDLDICTIEGSDMWWMHDKETVPDGEFPPNGPCLARLKPPASGSREKSKCVFYLNGQEKTEEEHKFCEFDDVFTLLLWYLARENRGRGPLRGEKDTRPTARLVTFDYELHKLRIDIDAGRVNLNSLEPQRKALAALAEAGKVVFTQSLRSRDDILNARGDTFAPVFPPYR